ncbi:MAG: hypothetical protein HC926_04015 [Synechococcaceae cyanobacterium SM2_3_60]|nr:hypothetical protein [Synechococcaceae cyanobacterium SM2_3_60]
MSLTIRTNCRRAFTLAALGEETLGLFEIDDVPWRLVRRQVRPNELYDRYLASRLHKRHIRLLDIVQPRSTQAPLFHQWHPEQLIRAGDEIVYIERVPEGREPAAVPSHWWEPLTYAWQRLQALDRPVSALVRDAWRCCKPVSYGAVSRSRSGSALSWVSVPPLPCALMCLI